MNQKERTRWELKLGLFQVVVLLGLTMGLLTCSFFLGYFSGRQVGQDATLSANLANTIKLPIDSLDIDEQLDGGASQRVASEVYAKLNTDGVESAKNSQEQQKVDVPKLGVIDTTDNSPVDELAGAVKGSAEDEEPLKEQAVDGAQDMDADQPAQVQPSREQLLKQVIELENSAKSEKGEDNHDLAVANTDPLKAEDLNKEAVASLKNSETSDLEDSKPALAVATKAPTPRPTPVEKKSTPTPKATPVKKVADQGESIQKGWFAQIAAPRKKEDAAELSRKLRKSGFAVIVEVAQVKGEQYYRVLTGPEPSKAQAEKLVEQLTREPYITGKPFIRQIK